MKIGQKGGDEENEKTNNQKRPNWTRGALESHFIVSLKGVKRLPGLYQQSGQAPFISL